MKNLSLIINAVLAIAIGVLFFLHFRDCKPAATNAGSVATNTNATPGTLIAYVDMDSLEANFVYYRDKKRLLKRNKKA